MGRLFFIPRPQSQEAGARGGGKGFTTHHWQRLDSATLLTNAGIETAKLADGFVCLSERR